MNSACREPGARAELGALAKRRFGRRQGLGLGLDPGKGGVGGDARVGGELAAP